LLAVASVAPTFQAGTAPRSARREPGIYAAKLQARQLEVFDFDFSLTQVTHPQNQKAPAQLTGALDFP
jgi:hypothetical protein